MAINAWVKLPATLTTTKVQWRKDVAFGSWLFVVALDLMLITGSALHLFWSFKILFLVRFSHTLFVIGQHTLLTANRC